MVNALAIALGQGGLGLLPDSEFLSPGATSCYPRAASLFQQSEEPSNRTEWIATGTHQCCRGRRTNPACDYMPPSTTASPTPSEPTDTIPSTVSDPGCHLQDAEGGHWWPMYCNLADAVAAGFPSCHTHSFPGDPITYYMPNGVFANQGHGMGNNGEVKWGWTSGCHLTRLSCGVAIYILAFTSAMAHGLYHTAS